MFSQYTQDAADALSEEELARDGDAQVARIQAEAEVRSRSRNKRGELMQTPQWLTSVCARPVQGQQSLLKGPAFLGPDLQRFEYAYARIQYASDVNKDCRREAHAGAAS